jgi:hypothetical protein
VERTVERVLIQPAAEVEVPDAAEARGAIAIEVPDGAEVGAPGAIVVGAPDVIVVEDAVAVETEDELRSAGLVQACSAVQVEPGVVVEVEQDESGVVAGLVEPAVQPVWLRAEWVVPAVARGESRVARGEFEAGWDG